MEISINAAELLYWLQKKAIQDQGTNELNNIYEQNMDSEPLI